MYLNQVITIIQEKLINSSKLDILEVGCGNGTNLKLIKDYFSANSSSLQLYGFDISLPRIETGKKYFGNSIESINLFQGDALSIESFQNKTWDIIFSVCALEQLSKAASIALRNMISQGDVIVITEPMPEIGSVEQKLYNSFNRQSVGLINELKNNLNIKKFTTPQLVEILHNPLSPVGTCIIYTKNKIS